MTALKQKSSMNISALFLPKITPQSVEKFSVMLHEIEFDLLDVFEVISHQENETSRSPDGIPQMVYRKLSAGLALPLFLIYRESVASGVVPEHWKTALVAPLHKGGSVKLKIIDLSA